MLCCAQIWLLVLDYLTPTSTMTDNDNCVDILNDIASVNSKTLYYFYFFNRKITVSVF